MIGLPEGLQPVAAAVVVYAVAWTLWRCFLARPREEVEAEKRAASLLGEMLSERERQQLALFGYLTVRSPTVASRVYRIPALPGWVDICEWGKLTMRICAQPSEVLPAADIVLMHKLMIQANEQEYLRLATVRWTPRG